MPFTDPLPTGQGTTDSPYVFHTYVWGRKIIESLSDMLVSYRGRFSSSRLLKNHS